MNLTDMLHYLEENYEFATALAALSGTVIAFLAFCISVISVFFTWRSVKNQQKHNALSVRPLPYITVGDYEDAIFVKIRNNGTGPLIIKSLKVLGTREPVQKLIDAMPALIGGVRWAHFSGLLEGRSIPVAGELKLIELKGDSTEDAFAKSRTVVREALGKLSLELEYTDVYDNCFPATKRDLTWFHRTIVGNPNP